MIVLNALVMKSFQLSKDFIGTDSGETVSPEEWAKLKGTHVYDILCSFGGRMERRYVFH